MRKNAFFRRIIGLVTPTAFFFSGIERALAAFQVGSSGLKNPLRYSTIQEFIAAVLDIVVRVGIPVVALFIIYAGFLFVKARGNPADLETAKRTLGWTLVGAAVVLGASILAAVIGGTISQLRGGF